MTRYFLQMVLESPTELLAERVIRTLFDAGFIAYIAGGWVRDRLRGAPTTEIDIATSASPDQIQKLFSRTIPVGAAFGVMIVVIDEVPFEVTTFRKDHPYLDGRHPEGVDFSTPEKDALRRDFTINGMFYDPLAQKLYDYVGGQKDLQKKVIRAIGDPATRFKEDRLRMIRAVRFAARFGFRIEEQTEQAIATHAHTLLPAVSVERVWQELTKMATYHHMDTAFLHMQRLGLLQQLFPTLHSIEEQVASFSYYPLDCPAIIYVMELFPEATLEEKRALCERFRVSNQESALATFFHEAKAPKEEAADWARFYAHPHAPLFLQIEAAKLLPPEREGFVREHDIRQQELAPFIGRTLLTAADLKRHGIPPGKKMGQLLKEGERLAINERLTDPEAIIARLKECPLWNA